MRPKCTKVRARSAKEGSATVGWSLAPPGPACFPVDKEDIADGGGLGRVLCASDTAQCAATASTELLAD
jgi:hypothetical protein